MYAGAWVSFNTQQTNPAIRKKIQAVCRGMKYLSLDAVRAQQDLDILEGGAGKMLVHHWLVHLLHQLQVEHMKVWLLQVSHRTNSQTQTKHMVMQCSGHQISRETLYDSCELMRIVLCLEPEPEHFVKGIADEAGQPISTCKVTKQRARCGHWAG